MHLTESAAEPTRDRIIDSATALFAEKGIDGVTTRAVAERANANLAAVNYHFGGKTNLAVEVFRRVARQSAEARLAGLERVLADPGGEAPRLEALIDVFVGAYLDPERRRDGALLAHLVLKHRAAPNGWTHAVVRDELDGMALRFIEALCTACPALPREEVHWRYHMMVGAIVLTLSDRGQQNRIQRLSAGTCSTGDLDALRGALVRFLTAAFREAAMP